MIQTEQGSPDREGAGNRFSGSGKKAGRSSMLRLAGSMLRIGLLGFGGGSALIPVIEEEVVTENKLVSPKEYDEDVVAACVTPGAMPVAIASGLGRRSFGVSGMILSACLMALPGAFLTILVLAVLSGSTAGSLDAVRFLSVGLGAYICCLLLQYVIKAEISAKETGRKEFWFSLVLVLSVFCLTCGKNAAAMFHQSVGPFGTLSTLNILMIVFFGIFFTQARLSKVKVPAAIAVAVLFILTAGKKPVIGIPYLKMGIRVLMAVLSAYGIAHSVREDMKNAAAPEIHPSELLKSLAAWAAFLVAMTLPALITDEWDFSFFAKAFSSSVISFGGGDAYLSVADGMFVSGGLVRDSWFYGTLVPVANVLPGSILTKVLSGVASYVGITTIGGTISGVVFAAAGFGISVAATGMAFSVTSWLFRTFRNITVFRQISRFIRPVISGLLLNVMLTMIRTSLSTGQELGAGMAATLCITGCILAADLYLMLKKKTGGIGPMIFSAAAGAGLMYLSCL